VPQERSRRCRNGRRFGAAASAESVPKRSWSRWHKDRGSVPKRPWVDAAATVGSVLQGPRSRCCGDRRGAARKTSARKGGREFGQKRRWLRQKQRRVKDGGALATGEARGMKVRSTTLGSCVIVSEEPGFYRKATEISPKWISITWPCYRNVYRISVANFATDPCPSEILAESY
jgi:hypothetical protein